MVGQAEEADLGLVAAVGHAAHDPLLHDLLLVAHDGALAGGFARLHETRQHPDGHVVGHRQLDRAGLQHLGAQGRHLQHLLVGDLGQAPGLGLDARVGRVDAVHVGVDVAVGAQRGGDGDCGGVGAPASQGGDAPVAGNALESRDHRHLAVVHRAAEVLGRNLVDAGLAVRRVGEDRDLPAEPGLGPYAHVAQRHGEQAGGHLLAGGHHHVVLVVGGIDALRGRAGAVGPGDQLIGLAGHCGDDHGHLPARLDLGVDQPRHTPDALQVGHRGAAELHHQARHGLRGTSE